MNRVECIKCKTKNMFRVYSRDDSGDTKIEYFNWKCDYCGTYFDRNKGD